MSGCGNSPSAYPGGCKLRVLGAYIWTCQDCLALTFVHYHKQNEEIYAVLTGKGTAVVDGDELQLTAGDWLRIAPSAKRQFFAAADSDLTYVCIQVKAGSLEGYTATDGVPA